jgi:hypothetical protein
MKTALFVSHTPKQCGVYQFGKDIFNVISASKQFNFIKLECESLGELKKAVAKFQPHVIIYNYHPAVMPWLCTKTTKGAYKNHVADIACIQVGIIHEITQQVADTASATRASILLGDPQKKLNSLFDFYIAADPTLLLMNPLVYKTGRLIPRYNGQVTTSNSQSRPVIGSFGFATPNKGFEALVEQVQKEFDEAVIRINMPSAFFGDKEGENSRKIAENCKAIIKKPGIALEISYDFLEEDKMLDFLAGNDLNAFFYQDKSGRGISSAVDNAMAVHKPVAVTDCPMFRHILHTQPSVCVDKLSLKEILSNGFSPLQKYADEWTPENLLWEYERILTSVFEKSADVVKPSSSPKKKLKEIIKKILGVQKTSFTWLRDTESATKDNLSIDKSLSYTPVTLPADVGLNRILDDAARELYKPAVDVITKAVPMTMAKKIDRANVQQAFIFDTVYRLLQANPKARLLCVGSYEDTASMTLIKMGYDIEEIDPMINYFLQEYYTKPSVKKGSFDIIFSTSVIEHDPDDKSFLECIEGLLAPGGTAVITCDYKDGWKPGDLKPDVDARLYTKNDMEKRMLSYIPKSELTDKGEWDCPNPDFIYLNKYQYTFATFVFRKVTA